MEMSEGQSVEKDIVSYPNKEYYIDEKVIIDSDHFINISKINKYFSEMDENEKKCLMVSEERFENILSQINGYLEGSKISNINSDFDSCEITFINNEGSTEFCIFLKGVVCHNIKKFDFDNILKVNISFGYSLAQSYSFKVGKDLLGIYIWDIHDKVMPKCLFIARSVTAGVLNRDGFDTAWKNYNDYLFLNIQRKNTK